MSLSVLQVASAFPHWGGAELHALTLSQQLQRRGYDVTVACRPGRFVEERAHQMGLATVPITVRKQNDWQDYGALSRFLREKQIDVLHAHWSTDMIVPPTAALRAHVPVRIMTRHMPYPFKNRLGSWLYSQVLWTRLVTVSASVRETLLACGVAPDKVEVIHHGTDIEEFVHTTASPLSVKRGLGIPDDCLTVGVVGRIAPEKGHLILLQAAALLGDRYPLRYVIVGDGPSEAAVRDAVRTLGLEDRVVFAGFRDDVNNVIAALDILTLPSTWNEPCAAVVQQAMALCKPVVGTRAGGTPEMIMEGETGVLVPPSDAPALADAIARLAGDAFLRKRLGAAGRERVESRFSLSLMTDRIEALYRREYEAARGAAAGQKVAAS